MRSGRARGLPPATLSPEALATHRVAPRRRWSGPQRWSSCKRSTQLRSPDGLGSGTYLSSPPAESGRDVRQDCLDHVSVVFDPELVRHGEQKRIGISDGFI